MRHPLKHLHLFFYQTGNPDEYKVSLRTNSAVDVSRIALSFGGGGHVRAAGCNVPGPLEHAKELLLEAVRKELTGA